MHAKSTLAGLVGLMLALVGTIGACSPSATELPTDATDETTPVEAVTDTTGALGGLAEVDVFAFQPVTPGGPTTVVVGGVEEPESLYLYSDSRLAASAVLDAIYDGPIESLGYGYQAVLVERLPKLGDADGDATLDTVSVAAGEEYVDADTGQVLTAEEALDDLPRLTVRFRIREGVTWQDGTPVTADDSVWSAELACDPETSTDKALCERTARYEKVDDRTVEWQGLPGYADPTYFTNFYSPLPRHQLGSDGRRMDEMSASEVAADEAFARRPYAYGPFSVDEWVEGDRIRLERNDGYWRADEGLPLLEAVDVRFYDDPDEVLAALLAGDVDVVVRGSLDVVEVEDLEQAAAEGRVVYRVLAGTSWEHIDFQLQPADDRIAPGACVEVRRAVALGTDRQAMVDEALGGTARVQDALVPAAHWAYPKEGLSTYEHQPETAGQLLEQLGFVDGDGDGVREATEDVTCQRLDADGEPVTVIVPAGTALEMTLATTRDDPVRERTSRMFQSDMAEIGISVVLDFVTAEELFAPGPQGVVSGRRYDLAQFAWLTGGQPPLALYTCGAIPGEGNDWIGQNTTGWCLPEYDALTRRAQAELDLDASLTLYSRAQALWSQELPVLPLFGRPGVSAARPDLVNFLPDEAAGGDTWNIEAWGIAPGE